jgi:hypothetical protein
MDPLAELAKQTAETFGSLQDQISIQWTVIGLLVVWNILLTILHFRRK